MRRPKYYDTPSPRIRFWVDRHREREAKAGWVNRCLMCETQFSRLPNGRRRRYCSNACRQKRHRQYSRATTKGRDFYANRRERAARSTLRRAERYRGRVDDTPIHPRSSISRRDYVLLDLSNGFPLDFCQWCARPMTRLNWLGPRYRTCSAYCNQRWHDFRRRLENALIKVDKSIHPIVKFRLSLFSLYSREPQGVLRFEVNVCDHCRKPYAVKGLTSRFCSKRCRQAAWRRSRRVCRYCTRRFKVDSINRKRHVYCSRDCRERYYRRERRERVTHRPCAGCGKPFKPPRFHGDRQRYCSKRCRIFSARRAKALPIMDRACLGCGKMFTPDRSNYKRHLYCHDPCRAPRTYAGNMGKK